MGKIVFSLFDFLGLKPKRYPTSFYYILEVIFVNDSLYFDCRREYLLEFRVFVIIYLRVS